MQIRTIKFKSSSFEEKEVSGELVDSITHSTNELYIIPTDYIVSITKNIKKKEYNNFDNEIDILILLDIIKFLIINEYHYSQYLHNKTSNYKRYIDFLKIVGIIDYVIPHSIEHSKTKTYILTKTSDSFSVIFIGDKKDDIIIDNEFTSNEYISQSDYKLDPIRSYTLLEAKIDVPLAIYRNHRSTLRKAINSLGVHYNYAHIMCMRLYAINRFLNHKRYINKAINCDRVFSSFTELSKESRESLYMDINGKREYFHEVDLKNAAPCLLANKIYVENNINSDFLNDCGSGVFYEKIMEEVKRIGGKEWYYYKEKKSFYFNKRDDIKVMVCASILFGDNNNPFLTKAFENLYKNEYNIIINEKNEIGKKKFASSIMNYEASVFVDIEPICYNFTTHDAIYFTNYNNTTYIEKMITDRMIDIFGENSKFVVSKTKNINDNDVIINDNDNDNDISTYIFDEKKDGRKNNREQIIMNIMMSGTTKTKDISVITGFTINNINKIKNKIKKNGFGI